MTGTGRQWDWTADGLHSDPAMQSGLRMAQNPGGSSKSSDNDAHKREADLFAIPDSGTGQDEHSTRNTH